MLISSKNKFEYLLEELQKPIADNADYVAVVLTYGFSYTIIESLIEKLFQFCEEKNSRLKSAHLFFDIEEYLKSKFYSDEILSLSNKLPVPINLYPVPRKSGGAFHVKAYSLYHIAPLKPENSSLVIGSANSTIRGLSSHGIHNFELLKAVCKVESIQLFKETVCKLSKELHEQGIEKGYIFKNHIKRPYIPQKFLEKYNSAFKLSLLRLGVVAAESWPTTLGNFASLRIDLKGSNSSEVERKILNKIKESVEKISVDLDPEMKGSFKLSLGDAEDDIKNLMDKINSFKEVRKKFGIPFDLGKWIPREKINEAVKEVKSKISLENFAVEFFRICDEIIESRDQIQEEIRSVYTYLLEEKLIENVTEESIMEKSENQVEELIKTVKDRKQSYVAKRLYDIYSRFEITYTIDQHKKEIEASYNSLLDSCREILLRSKPKKSSKVILSEKIIEAHETNSLVPLKEYT